MDATASGVYILPPYLQGPPSRRLTRRSKVRPATLFVPHDGALSPEAHFPLQTVARPGGPRHPRFINRFDSREILLVVDGSCLNNGRHANKLQPPVAGCAFIFKGGGTPGGGRIPAVTFPFHDDDSGPGRHQQHQQQQQQASGGVAFRLEREGPRGEAAEHTSNRAKLRAVIAALQFRAWGAGGEGWCRVVVLTDLEYIVRGATAWLPRWVARRWRKPRSAGGGRYYLNRDLWEELQHCIDELRAQGCDVAFWLVKDEGRQSRFIAQAKAAAQHAARAYPGAQVERFTKLCGIMI